MNQVILNALAGSNRIHRNFRCTSGLGHLQMRFNACALLCDPSGLALGLTIGNALRDTFSMHRRK